MQLRFLKLLYFLIVTFANDSIWTQIPKNHVRLTDYKLLPLYELKKLENTAMFQGNNKRNNYFEGWYFKMVSRDGSSILSIIPGISISKDGQIQHAFIQLINGITAETSYYTFPIDAFSFSISDFAVAIDNNYFSKDSIILNIRDQNTSISGKIKNLRPVEYTSDKFTNIGIMGWYRFVPFMECYHGVVSLTHQLQGSIKINSHVFDFDHGKGYIEKDWGTSMPSSWIWMQCNNFTDTNSSFMLSVATIPWIGKSFTGFLGFYYLNNELYHFATYRSSRLHVKIIGNNQLSIKIEDHKNTILLNVSSKNTGLLQAPVSGAMDRRIPESIDAEIKITLLDKNGYTQAIDSSRIAGLEMVGDFYSLQGVFK